MNAEEFRKWWANFEGHNYKPLTRALRKIVESCPSQARVLDIGSGAGRVMQALQEKGCVCTGLDISPGNVQYATDLGLDVHLTDVDRLVDEKHKLLAGPYDVVIFSRVLAYIAQKNELFSQLNPKIVYIYEGQQASLAHFRSRAEPKMRFRIKGKEYPGVYLSPRGYSAWMAQYGFGSSQVLHWNANPSKLPFVQLLRSSSVAMKFAR